MMFDKHANLKYKFGNRHFWVEGDYVSTVGVNEATIKNIFRIRRGMALQWTNSVSESTKTLLRAARNTNAP